MTLYIVSVESCYCQEIETEHRYFLDEDNARQAYFEEVKEAKVLLQEEGAVGEILDDDIATEEDRDLDCPVYLYHEDENCFEYWPDGCYCDEHLSVTFEMVETED